ncbi:MAG: PEP-CTERM sorting domain-containing protein, partial [Microcoleus sp. SIO2G3]|nr:PEP-CTERM sorting domain-containing protein [Microcoleus sp. SIO2G3]
RELEQASDRFNREVEDQQLPQPTSQTIPSVPEPAEWLLLIVVAIWLIFIYSRQKRHSQLVE